MTVAPFTDYEGLGTDGTFTGGPSIILMVISAATFIAGGSVITSLLLLVLITGEKARKLVGSLRTIGLYESTHVLAWYTASIPFFIFTGLATATVGAATGIAFFTNVPWGIHAIATMLLMASTGALVICCASCVRSTVAVNITAFVLFAATAVITAMFSALGLFTVIYSPIFPPVILFTLVWLPGFHYGRLVQSILYTVYLTGGTQQQQAQSPSASSSMGVGVAAHSGAAWQQGA